MFEKSGERGKTHAQHAVVRLGFAIWQMSGDVSIASLQVGEEDMRMAVGGILWKRERALI